MTRNVSEKKRNEVRYLSRTLATENLTFRYMFEKNILNTIKIIKSKLEFCDTLKTFLKDRNKI